MVGKSSAHFFLFFNLSVGDFNCVLFVLSSRQHLCKQFSLWTKLHIRQHTKHLLHHHHHHKPILLSHPPLTSYHFAAQPHSLPHCVGPYHPRHLKSLFVEDQHLLRGLLKEEGGRGIRINNGIGITFSSWVWHYSIRVSVMKCHLGSTFRVQSVAGGRKLVVYMYVTFYWNTKWALWSRSSWNDIRGWFAVLFWEYMRYNQYVFNQWHSISEKIHWCLQQLMPEKNIWIIWFAAAIIDHLDLLSTANKLSSKKKKKIRVLLMPQVNYRTAYAFMVHFILNWQ